ncbi:hypothetical protein AB0I10_22330 [Streptomyces sp. NPDC050636]|uniref:hypothetical protein n=1 Tax=Streptomyces sp. NPDC050636 TaxID=3154510 RepID=UPI00341F3CEE
MTERPARPSPARTWLRASLFLLATVQLTIGIWQLFSPRSFFDMPWVAALPPYNEHLMRDLGAMNLALAIMLGAAAYVSERRLTYVALLAYLAFNLPHLAFHTTHFGHQSAASARALVAVLALGVLWPGALFAALCLGRVRLSPRCD